MFGGARKSSKSKSKSKNKGISNPGGDNGGSKGKGKLMIPNLEMDDDDKHFFYSRLLSREPNNNSHPSFRVYYGDVSVAVPFTWESQPGTPKSKFHVDSSDHRHISYSAPLPPLTPPPSYFSSSSTTKVVTRRQLSKKQSSSSRWPTYKLLSFRKNRPSNSNNNNNKNDSVGSSSSSSENSANSTLSPTRSISSTRDRRHSSDNLLYGKPRRVSSLEALLNLKPDEGINVDGSGSGSGSGSSPTSTLCFGGSSRRLRGRYGSWL